MSDIIDQLLKERLSFVSRTGAEPKAFVLTKKQLEDLYLVFRGKQWNEKSHDYKKPASLVGIPIRVIEGSLEVEYP